MSTRQAQRRRPRAVIAAVTAIMVVAVSAGYVGYRRIEAEHSESAE